jgi:hypothetical protein
MDKSYPDYSIQPIKDCPSWNDNCCEAEEAMLIDLPCPSF